MSILKRILVISTFIISLYGLQGCSTPSHINGTISYSNPAWAPGYYAGIRYYYLPDIEVYYDLSNQEFVYLDNGRWLFSPVLPQIYSSYDLFNGFIIALSINVYQPWMHHHYYVSHYPRYYYNNVYHNMDISKLRGFNENERAPIYWRQDDRDRIDDLRRRVSGERKIELPKTPQKTNYYGKNIGQPVKVRPQMKEPKPSKKVQRPVRGGN